MPTPEQIKAARESAKLSQEQAAELVRVTPRAWQFWESGARTMSEGTWELFTLKAEILQNKQHKEVRK